MSDVIAESIKAQEADARLAVMLEEFENDIDGLMKDVAPKSWRSPAHRVGAMIKTVRGDFDHDSCAILAALAIERLLKLKVVSDG